MSLNCYKAPNWQFGWAIYMTNLGGYTVSPVGYPPILLLQQGGGFLGKAVRRIFRTPVPTFKVDWFLPIPVTCFAPCNTEVTW